MAKIDPDFPHDAYRFIPKHVRDRDRLGILERFMGGPQYIWENIHADIQDVDTLHDLDRIRDEFLIYLKHHVGWTNELDSITADLDATQLRKLIELSVPFWKLKGTELGIRDALRLLTGRDVVIRNWFYYRWTVGITRLWRVGDHRDSFVVGQTHGERDQYLSVIFVSNELPIDRQLVRDLVNLNRPLQERYKVAYVDLVDDFGVGRGRWSFISGDADATWDEDRKLLSIPPSAGAGQTIIQVNVDSVTTWEDTVWRASTAFTAAAGGAMILVSRYQDTAPNDRYAILFLQTGAVAFAKFVGGVGVIVASGTVGHAIPQGETAFHGVDMFRDCEGRLKIRVTWYATEILTVTLGEPDVIPPGQWRVINAGAGSIELDNVVAYQTPILVDEVSGPGTVQDAPDPADPGPCPVYDDTTFSTWTLASQWHTTTFRYVTAGTSLYFGAGESGYHTWGMAGAMGPGIVSGSATSPSIDLSDYSPSEYEVLFEFRYFPDLRANPDDVVTIDFLVSGSPVLTIPLPLNPAAWAFVRGLDISSYVGGEADVRIRFNLDTVTIPSPSNEGLYIDQVRLLVGEK